MNESAFDQFERTRLEWQRYKNLPRMEALAHRAHSYGGAISVSHYDRAFQELRTEQGWKVVPAPRVGLPGPEVVREFQSMNMDDLKKMIYAAGERSELNMKYQRCVREYGLQPILFPPSDVSDEDLDDFERAMNKMPLADQKARYRGDMGEGTAKGSFKWFHDRLTQRSEYRASLTSIHQLTARQYHAMSPMAIALKLQNDQEFRKQVENLRREGMI